MGLMTPVLKGVLTDTGFANAVQAQQVFGGHGYIAENGMEQFVRDARIAMLYEGANGIQALDLVGRKLPKDGGRAVMAFFNEVGAFVKENDGDAALAPYLKPLKAGPRPPAAGDDVVHAERHGEARQCRRRLHRLHASLRAGGARLHVGADGEGGGGEARDGADGRADFYETRLTLGQLFHGARHAGDGGAPRAHLDGRRHDDDAAGGGVLSARVAFPLEGVRMRPVEALRRLAGDGVA